tara:strand:+ start:25 stop:387 length:363 start_codon:yes stop_codon:yes gene_type:complete
MHEVFTSIKSNGEIGLFSTRKFKDGELLFELCGAKVSEPTRESIRVDEGVHIIDSYGSYMNHSCDPTVVVDGLRVVASGILYAGEEVTFDYRTTEDVLSCPFVCECCGEAITYGQDSSSN